MVRVAKDSPGGKNGAPPAPFFRKYGARVHTAFSHWRYLTVITQRLMPTGSYDVESLPAQQFGAGAGATATVHFSAKVPILPGFTPEQAPLACECEQGAVPCVPRDDTTPAAKAPPLLATATAAQAQAPVRVDVGHLAAGAPANPH
jgi:hypothetical protein